MVVEKAAQFAAQDIDAEVLKNIKPGDEGSLVYQQIAEKLNESR